MEFIDHEATEDHTESNPVVFSDDEEEITNDEMEDYINDTNQPREDVRFYRQLDPDNLEHYPKFPNQTRDPILTVYEEDEPCFGKEDTQPKLYVPENRGDVEFNNFSALKIFKEGSDNPFFDAISFGVMTYMTEGKKTIDWGKIQEATGNDFYNDFLEIKDDIKLGRSIFGYIDICFLANQVLVKHITFCLKFFESRDFLGSR